jgi:hypothetical protein
VEWSEVQLERLDDPSVLAMLSDATLNRMLRELDQWCDG